MIILSGWVSTKMQWKLKYESATEEFRGANLLTIKEAHWTAWPSDTQVEESGAPVLDAPDIEGVIEKIKIFEQGTMYESDSDK